MRYWLHLLVVPICAQSSLEFQQDAFPVSVINHDGTQGSFLETLFVVDNGVEFISRVKIGDFANQIRVFALCPSNLAIYYTNYEATNRIYVSKPDPFYKAVEKELVFSDNESIVSISAISSSIEVVTVSVVDNTLWYKRYTIESGDDKPRLISQGKRAELFSNRLTILEDVRKTAVSMGLKPPFGNHSLPDWDNALGDIYGGSSTGSALDKDNFLLLYQDDGKIFLSGMLDAQIIKIPFSAHVDQSIHIQIIGDIIAFMYIGKEGSTIDFLNRKGEVVKSLRGTKASFAEKKL